MAEEKGERRNEKAGAECCNGLQSAERFGKSQLCCGRKVMEKVSGCRAESRAKEAECEDRWETEHTGRWVVVRVSHERGNDERRSHERGTDGRGSEERGRDKRGRDERGSVDKERRCNMLQGIAVCCIIL